MSQILSVEADSRAADPSLFTGTGVMGLMFPWMLLESKAVNLASDKEFLMDSTLDYVLKIVDFGCLSSFRLNYLTNEEVSAAFTPKNSPF